MLPQKMNRPDPEDLKEAPETPGEKPDAEDLAEGPETENEPASDASEPADTAGKPEEADQGGEDTPNVSPDEQKMYDTCVTSCLNQIFDEQAFPAVVQKLKAGVKNLSGAIGHTGAMILMSVQASAQKDGKTIPDDVLYAASQEVVTALVQIAEGAKLMDPKQEKAITEAAMYEGVRVWGDNLQKTKGITADVQSQAQNDLADAGIQTDPSKAQSAQGAQPPASAPAASPPTGGGIVNAATQGAPQ